MPRRRTPKRRKRRTQKRRKKRRKTRKRKGGKIIDHWKLRPGMVVKRVPWPHGGPEVWKITSTQNNKISYDVLSPAGSPSGEIPMIIIPVLDIRFDLIEKASPQSLVEGTAKFAARKSKKRIPSIQSLALGKISTLDRKKIKEHMPVLLKPKKINIKNN
jgi:hypothetical protein